VAVEPLLAPPSGLLLAMNGPALSLLDEVRAMLWRMIEWG